VIEHGRTQEGKADSLLNTKAMDELLVLCEEVMRATPEGAKRFIEPAPGTLSRAKSKQHNIIFGRRGSGKSTLLRKMAADLTVDRRPIAFVDMETFKGHTYPDVLISVLLKSLHEFQNWLNEAATTPATKKSFWHNLFGTVPNRPPFKKTEANKLKNVLISLVSDLENQLAKPEISEIRNRESADQELASSGNVKVGTNTPYLDAGISHLKTSKTARRSELESSYTSHKIEYLHQNILRFQQFFF